MVPRRDLVAVLLCTTMLLSVLANPVVAKEEHFLDYSEDNFKAVFMSGNLTVAVTHDWPRMVFEHSTDPFTPTFEVGFQDIFLYDDSNDDGYFTLSEITYVSYLDENHVNWNVTPVEFLNDTVAGEYATFRMNATLDLYKGLDNETVSIGDWANVTFWFKITERGYYLSNSLGSYLVLGKTDLSFNFTLDVLKSVNTTGIVMEQLLQGGGSTYMFMIRQLGRYHSVQEDLVSGRVDQTVYGTNFTNGFFRTELPDQQISFAKDDRTEQAYYRWDSEAVFTTDANGSVPAISDTYFTTGTGLILHNAYMIGNETGSIFQTGLVGIDETAFIGKLSNWIRDNIWGIVIVTGAMCAVIVSMAFTMGRIRKRRAERACAPDPPAEEKKQD